MSTQRLAPHCHDQETADLNDDKDDQVLPGAWPITPMHKRTRTHPLQSQERAMHQHRIPIPIQGSAQRENTALPEPSPSRVGFGPISSSFGVPSDDSNLTQFTPSNSALTVPSVTSSSTTVTSLATTISKPEILTPENSLESDAKPLHERIHQPLPSRECDESPAKTVPQIFPHAEDMAPRTPAPRSIRLPTAVLTPPVSSPHSHFTGSPGSNASFQLSLSPIVFTSPTSSTRPRRTRVDMIDTYDYNSSWKSSGDDSTHDNSGCLRIGTPSPTPSPSPSPISVHDHGRREVLTVSVTSPSVDELPLPPQAMLTTLSLPGSLNDDSLSLNLPVPFERQPSFSSMNQSNFDTSASLSLTPVSQISDLIGSPTSTTSPSVFSGTDLEESPSRTHIIRLPPSTSSPGPITTSVAQGRESFSATEYAHAVVMSSWGSNDAFIRPLVSPSNVPAASIIPDISVSHSLPEGPANPNRSRRSVTFAEDPRPRNGILRRVKKLGSKFMRFFLGQGQAKPRNQSAPIRSVLVQHSQDVVDISANQFTGSQLLPRLEREVGGEELAGVLANRTRRRRPSLTPETYTPTVDDPTSTSPSQHNLPGGQDNQAISEEPADASNIPNLAEGSTSPQFEFQDQLAEHARPKTVEEIKAKRPFSISALPSFTGSPSSSTKPSPRSQRSSRPVSDLVMVPSHSSLYRPGQTAGLHRGYSASHVVLPSARQSLIPPPPGLENSNQSGRQTPSGHVNRSSSPLPADERRSSVQPASGPTTPIKETRRFSLSAFSSFAAGLKQQGTWARYSDNSRQ
ncbi:hypothetical protein AAF712_000947 [Marasmius tenuissimus]|uniref:Uncharacterized protein n=1 Tax=Marasmius tenuissimus TaxID=585030 RepID=A0ABR3AGC9_9AGAR